MASDAAFRFSTDQIPAKDRLAVYREVIGRQFLSLDIEPSAIDFRAQFEVHKLPSTVITVVEATPAKFIRTARQARSGDGDYTLVRAVSDGFRFYRDEYGQAFDAGEGMLLFNAGGGTIEGTVHDSKAVTMRIDGNLLRAGVGDLDEMRPHHLTADRTPLRLVASYLDCVLAGAAVDRALGQLVAIHITDLLALALRPSTETRERAAAGAVPAARRAAIKADVSRSLGRPELSVDTVAARHGISPRYVHMLFEAEGITFSAFVLAERLARAHRMLIDPRCAALKVSEIAFAVGFGDLSYFNRCFRRQFGDTPSAIRAEARIRAT